MPRPRTLNASHRQWHGTRGQEARAEPSGSPHVPTSFWVKIALLILVACIPLVGTPLVIAMLPCAPRRYGLSIDGGSSGKWINLGIALIIVSGITIAGTGLFEVVWKGFDAFKEINMPSWMIITFVAIVEMMLCAFAFYQTVFKRRRTLPSSHNVNPNNVDPDEPLPMYGSHELHERVSIPTRSRPQSAAPSYRNSWRQSQQGASSIELDAVSSPENSSDQNDRRRPTTSQHSSIRSLITRSGSGSQPSASRSSSRPIAHSSEEEEPSSSEDDRFPLNIDPRYNAPHRHSSTRRESLGGP